MPIESIHTLWRVLEVVRPAFTPASFALLVLLFQGWILTGGRHAITECMLAAGVGGTRDHSAFYRFFSRGTWKPDEVGRLIFLAVLARLAPDARIHLVIDDTLAKHKGPYIFGLGCHLDAVRSSRKTKVFAFGHVWVVLALVIPLPLARRGFALPILCRLYRDEKQCLKSGASFRKKTELAREMLDLVVGWLSTPKDTAARVIQLAIDSGYTNRTVLHDLPPSVEVIGAMRPDAALEITKGVATLSPKSLAADETVPWMHVKATLYGQEHTVQYKTVQAPWARVCGELPLQIVIVRCVVGDLALRIFFSTDAAREVRSLLESYAFVRWPIEVTFRDMKQWLGLAEAAVRQEASVLRVVPFVGMIFSLLGLWHMQSPVASMAVTSTERPWYRTKKTVAFFDILQAARKCLATRDFRDIADRGQEGPSRQMAFTFLDEPYPRIAA
jgi:DDE superfamily endonuclease